MQQTQIQYENSEPILKIIHNMITWFSEQKEMYGSIFSNNNKIQNSSMLYDFSQYNGKKIFERKVFLWLMIALEGFYSKTVAYYFLHVKAGIPYDLIPQMWLVDFIIAFFVALIITKLSLIGVTLGLEKYRESGSAGTKYHFFGISILLLVPIVNIWYKLSTDPSINIVLSIVIPILLFIVTAYAVYIIADRTIKFGARDEELKKALKEKVRLETINGNFYRECKEYKKEIEQGASKLSILLSKVANEKSTDFLSMFPKIEKHIIYEILFSKKPGDLAVNENGKFEDLSDDEFYKFFMSL